MFDRKEFKNVTQQWAKISKSFPAITAHKNISVFVLLW